MDQKINTSNYAKSDLEDMLYKSIYNAVWTPNLSNSAKYIDFSSIFKKIIHALIVGIILIPLNYILNISALICCYVSLYRLMLIVVGDRFENVFIKSFFEKSLNKNEKHFVQNKHKDICFTFTKTQKIDHDASIFIKNNQSNQCIFETHAANIDRDIIEHFKYIANEKINQKPLLIDQAELEYSEDLPIYSILVPIYKEANKIGEIISALTRINYPKSKLDVKLVIESDDIETIHSIGNEILPSFIEVIKVPNSYPKTKPKALNYAVNFIKGEVVAVYDAEDIPESDQLLKVVDMFSKLPSEYICIQCKLNFFNFNENIIAEFMSIEYATLFNYILPGSESLLMPILLGGTSNHFKVEKLKAIGYWDSYNVTEDAELAIRIYMKGYKVKMINSITLEEAPTEIKTFIKQRSRWIKGFLQTFFCYLKYLNFKHFKFHTIVFIVTNLLLFSISMFLGPILIISAFFIDIKFLNFNFYIFTIYHLLVSIIANPYNSKHSDMFQFKSAKIIATNKGLTSVIARYINLKYLLCAPAYYSMHSIAFVLAIFDLLFKPFDWRKTTHGNSSTKIDKSIVK